MLCKQIERLARKLNKDGNICQKQPDAVEFCKIFRNNFSAHQIWVTASEMCIEIAKIWSILKTCFFLFFLSLSRA